MKLKTIKLLLSLSLLSAFAGCSKEPASGHGDVKLVQEINCVNNLKQIGLVFKIWAGDHGDKFPFEISTNAGGTLELVQPDQNGNDRNAFLYLKKMNEPDELGTPLLLACPQDKTKKAATNWTNLQPENVTYQFCTGTNLDSFNRRILAVCPVHGNVLFCDGFVAGKNANPETKPTPVFFDSMKHQIESEKTK